MKLQFVSGLDFQLDVIEAVCELFKGQEEWRSEFTVAHTASALALAETNLGFLPSSGPWLHDGSKRPIAFLEELGRRLVRPTPKDTRQIRLHWHRFQSLNTGASFPSWDEIASNCQTEGTRVLEVYRAWNTCGPCGSGHRHEGSDDGEFSSDDTDGKNT